MRCFQSGLDVDEAALAQLAEDIAKGTAK